jgi:hypothetical protein
MQGNIVSQFFITLFFLSRSRPRGLNPAVSSSLQRGVLRATPPYRTKGVRLRWAKRQPRPSDQRHVRQFIALERKKSVSSSSFSGRSLQITHKTHEKE